MVVLVEPFETTQKPFNIIDVTPILINSKMMHLNLRPDYQPSIRQMTGNHGQGLSEIGH